MVSCARPPSGVTSRKVRPSSLSKPAPRPAGTDEVTDHVLHADVLPKEMRAGPALCGTRPREDRESLQPSGLRLVRWFGKEVGWHFLREWIEHRQGCPNLARPYFGTPGPDPAPVHRSRRVRRALPGRG